MPRSSSVRGRAPLLAAAIAAAAALNAAGCGSEEGPVEGPVTVYVSLPLTGPRTADGTDAANGARLALEQAGGRAGELEVQAEFLDDAHGRPWDPVVVGENARTAVQDSSTAAYIGELDSEPTRGSLPITNEAGIVQVSPGAGAVDLTRAAAGYPDSPGRHRPSGNATFARLVPDDAVQARAAAALAVQLGETRVAVDTGATPFGKLIASEFAIGAAGVGLEIAGAGADTRLEADAGGGPLRLVGERTAEISVALDPANLAGEAFAGDFEKRYGRAPGPYAAYGYEAMDLVLDAIGQAKSSDDGFRKAVVAGVLDAERPDSILGRYSITGDGDTTLCAAQPYEIRADAPSPGKPICPSG